MCQLLFAMCFLEIAMIFHAKIKSGCHFLINRDKSNHIRAKIIE